MPFVLRPRAGSQVVALSFAICMLAVACRRESGTPKPPGAEEKLVLFVAASFADVTRALADSFLVAHPGVRPVVSLASSSVLARQIASGAHADVFMSANRSWVQYLDSLELLSETAELNVTNKLALYWPGDAPKPSLHERASTRRIAVGDPEHVPVGRYVKRYLQCTGRWDLIEPSIITAADARAALQLLRARAVDGAISYLSDSSFAGDNVLVAVLADSCQPDIRYQIAVVASTRHGKTAQEFLRFASGASQRQIWELFGFEGAKSDRSPYRPDAEIDTAGMTDAVQIP